MSGKWPSLIQPLTFVKEAEAAVEMIVAKEKLPIIGGTGYSIQKFVEGYHSSGSASMRRFLAYWAELDTLAGWGIIYKIAELARTLDNCMAGIRHTRKGNCSFGEWTWKQTAWLMKPLLICLDDESRSSYERINQRGFNVKGLLEEAKCFEDNYPLSKPAKELQQRTFPILLGKDLRGSCLISINLNKILLAKRQLTWFRNRMNATLSGFRAECQRADLCRIYEEFLNDWNRKTAGNERVILIGVELQGIENFL